MYTIMDSLTKNEFKSLLGSLSITHDTVDSRVNDEVDVVCTVNTLKSKIWVSDTVFYDGQEYTLTESQKDTLVDLIYDDNVESTINYNHNKDYDVREHGVFGFGY